MIFKREINLVKNAEDAKRFSSLYLEEKEDFDRTVGKFLDLPFLSIYEGNPQTVYNYMQDLELVRAEYPEYAVNKLAFLDFETSHLNGYAVSLAIKINGEEGKYWTINPKVQLDPEAMEVNQLDPAVIENSPTFEELRTEIESELSKADCIVAYNAIYDQGVFVREYERLGIKLPDIITRAIDPMPMIKNQMVYPKGVRATAPSLKNAALSLGIDLSNRVLHNALDDTVLLEEVFNAAGQQEIIHFRKE